VPLPTAAGVPLPENVNPAAEVGLLGRTGRSSPALRRPNVGGLAGGSGDGVQGWVVGWVGVAGVGGERNGVV